MISSPTELTGNGEAVEEVACSNVYASDQEHLSAVKLSLFDGVVNERPTTSESCTRGKEKKSRTSSNDERRQSGDDSFSLHDFAFAIDIGEVDVDANGDANSTEDYTSTPNDDNQLRQKQEEQFASLFVNQPHNVAKNIVDILLKKNSKDCLHTTTSRQWLRRRLKAKTRADVICNVNLIDDSVLEELIPLCQDREVNHPSSICCIRPNAKKLYFHCHDTSQLVTRDLCHHGDCTCLANTDHRTKYCGQHIAVEKRRNDIASSLTSDKPYAEELSRRILIDLRSPQKKEVVEFLVEHCKGSIGKTARNNICIDVDDISWEQRDLLETQLEKLVRDATKQRVAMLVGFPVPQLSEVEESRYMNIHVRSFLKKRGWAHKKQSDSVFVESFSINKEGNRIKTKAANNTEKGEEASTTFPSPLWLPETCSIDIRIRSTKNLNLQKYQATMVSDRVAVDATSEMALICINDIRDKDKKKRALDAYRKRLGLESDAPVSAKSIATVFRSVVLPHNLINVDAPPFTLIHYAITHEKFGQLFQLIPSSELPLKVKNKFKNKPDALGEYSILIHDPKEFTETCLAQVWGHQSFKMFKNASANHDVMVYKNGGVIYICHKSITHDLDSIIESDSNKELRKQVKAHDEKEQHLLRKLVDANSENIRLKARIEELEKNYRAETGAGETDLAILGTSQSEKVDTITPGTAISSTSDDPGDGLAILGTEKVAPILPAAAKVAISSTSDDPGDGLAILGDTIAPRSQGGRNHPGRGENRTTHVALAPGRGGDYAPGHGENRPTQSHAQRRGGGGYNHFGGRSRVPHGGGDNVYSNEDEEGRVVEHRLVGTVVRFLRRNNYEQYGFIKVDGREDKRENNVFFHFKDVVHQGKQNHLMLNGCRVTFVMKKKRDGRETATGVKIIGNF